ncbi:MAG: hypothetical protein WAX66_02775 [Patescibacteria group bacterium]
MSKEKYHAEPFCHSCYADLKQPGSVTGYFDDGSRLFCHLIPGENNTFDILIDGSNEEIYAIVNPKGFTYECFDCREDLVFPVGSIDFDPDAEFLNLEEDEKWDYDNQEPVKINQKTLENT